MLLSSAFVGLQVKQSAKDEVQQYNKQQQQCSIYSWHSIHIKVDNMLYILYFKYHALFSLNAAVAFSQIICMISWDSYFVCFCLFVLIQIVPSTILDLLSRLSQEFAYISKVDLMPYVLAWSMFTVFSVITKVHFVIQCTLNFWDSVSSLQSEKLS